MGDFVAYPSKWRIVLLVIASPVGVVGSLWMVGLFGPIPSGHYPPEVYFVAGCVGIPFSGFCGLVCIKRFLDSGEQLRIGQGGVRVRAWSDQTIPWVEIINLTIWSYERQRMIVLHLRDPSLYPGRGTLGMMARANRALTGGDICISLTGSDRSFDEAMAAINQFKPQYRR